MANDAKALSTIKPDGTDSAGEVFGVFARALLNVHFPPVDAHGNPNVGRFLLDHGRLPAIGDDVQPWLYRGWLIPYVQMCEQHPAVSPRYDYVLRTIDGGKLLDEPIPQCRFVSEHSNDAKPGTKMLTDMIKSIERQTGYSRSMDAMAGWLAFATGVSTEPSDLDHKTQEQLYRSFDVSKWLMAPTDYLGEVMAEAGHGKAGGFFPTPMGICTMMSMMTFGDGGSLTATSHDPAVGTGRTLLAASNYSLRLSGQDINFLCVTVAKINLALFAPWFYIPESFFPIEERPEPPPMPVKEPVFTTEVSQPTLFGPA